MKIIQIIQGPPVEVTTFGNQTILVPSYVMALTDDGRLWLQKKKMPTDPKAPLELQPPDSWLLSDWNDLPFCEKPSDLPADKRVAANESNL